MTSFDEIPDSIWFTKYNNYVGILLRESIAVAWRHAAINGLDSEEIINQKLISVISDYFQARDLKAPEGTIKNIVGKMVKQWKTRICSVAFLSTQIETRGAFMGRVLQLRPLRRRNGDRLTEEAALHR